MNKRDGKQRLKATVNLQLSADEALILFEFLSRYSDTDRFDIQDQAEQRVLWDILAQLEKTLVEPFMPDYADVLAKAWERMRDPVS